MSARDLPVVLSQNDEQLQRLLLGRRLNNCQLIKPGDQLIKPGDQLISRQMPHQPMRAVGKKNPTNQRRQTGGDIMEGGLPQRLHLLWGRINSSGVDLISGEDGTEKLTANLKFYQHKDSINKNVSY